MEVGIIAGPRGDVLFGSKVVARIGQWDVRSFPGGDWEGSCECEWYSGSDPDAFDLLNRSGIEATLRLKDYNEAIYECIAVAVPEGEVKMLGDVALLELKVSGSIPMRRV